MEYKTFVLKKNNSKIRQRIKDAGIHLCLCASFVDSCWLVFHTSIANGVHGVGYWDEKNGTHSQEEELARFTSTCTNMVVCEDVDDFIYNINDFLQGE